MSDKHLSKTRFDSFPFSAAIMAGIRDAGFEYCTPIQAQTLPIALDGRDVAGQAQTGTGKTAAFLLTILHTLDQEPAELSRRPNQPRALVLAPTRELAVQIYNDACVLAAHTGLKVRVVYGGTGYDTQRKAIEEGVDILIGTPGRIIDYFKQHVFDLRAVQTLVLDEADRMFDLGFIKDIRFLLRRCPTPENRQGMLFSATLSYRVTELAYEHMNNPEKIVVEAEQITADRVRETAYMVANDEKVPLLIGLMRQLPEARVIVFINTKREADRVWGFLEGNGYQAAILSGDVPQKKRLSLLKRFSSGEVSVLVATDVAARGLHIEGVTHVINYDLPEDAEDYVHRIGRTARAGAEGDAISFVCETYAFSLPDIEQYIGHKVPVAPVSKELLAEVDPRSRVRIDKADRVQRREGDGRGKRRGPPGRGGAPRGASDKPAAEQPSGERPRRRRRRKPNSGGAAPA
ncbi:MAG: ATP-dependent RNA helicase RhlB [Chromatiaceae bacterium]|nr:ATP-dependent RNA helicase RhlB [Gammaproteobacteria bacterium]MCP5305343.1 ATP-dependent RNA helicase RhlB [Chromatiaceae bacterium]MCP5315302.1 ATP-dependent RNA helicase RhlB [Chromatiaceae bacterium]